MNMNIIAEQSRRIIVGAVMLMLSACASSDYSFPSPFAARGPEHVFATPEQAGDALADATRRNDKAELLKILGPAGSKIIRSGDPVADKHGRDRFIAAYDCAHSLERDDDIKATLVVGSEEWPLPIPLMHVAVRDNVEGGWQFDTEAGKQEILNRRIGRNELRVLETSRAYVEAQREFADRQRNPKGRVEYAQHFISTPGKHDGLYWPTKAGEEESPLGPLVANARAEGYAAGEKHKRHPYHGYYYKILKRQGSDAAGGAKAYITGGRMTKGFALIAFPAQYGNSGVMTFIVNQDGIVFEKNLGRRTAERASRITQYNPDESWKVVASR